jgi:outer membrane protein assembly factor BamB
LARSWPAEGPRRLWSRDLGAGHSAIAVDNAVLYTMYSRGEQEAVVAIAAATGQTVWEYQYAAPTKGMDYGEGKGPHSTPLVTERRVFTTGALGKLLALEKDTGKVAWSHDLWAELHGTKLDQGYASSPIAYGPTVIVTVGGKGQAVMAFAQSDGAVVWKSQDFEPSPSSPVLIDVAGQPQLVAFAAQEIAGLDPASGELLWRHEHRTKWGLNISTPVWCPGNLLFCSSAYDGGSRVLHLTRSGGRTTVRQVWYNRKVRVHFGSVLCVGDLLYAPTGDFGATFITAIGLQTGKVAWQVRFPKSTLLRADGKLLLLGEDGKLALAVASATGLEVIARASVLETKAWTVPTLVGTILYVRDRKRISALDLG